MTELRPNPIRSDTSRRGTTGAPAGEPGAARRRPARSVSRGLDVTSPTIPPHEPCASRKREERRAHVAPARLAYAKPAGRTRRRHPACAERSRRPGSDEGRSACAVPTTIRGRGPLHPILREEDRDPQAPEVPSIHELPRPSCVGLRRQCSGSRDDAELSLRLPRRAGVLHRLLPACGEHTARLTTVHPSNRLDGPFVVEGVVSVTAGRAEARPVTHRGTRCDPRPHA
jgi:hypothetical protein